MGHRLGYVSSYFPKELALAMGYVPVRVIPSGVDVSQAEAVLPRNFCAYLKLVAATLLEEPESFDLVVILEEDESHRRLGDVLREVLPCPVITSGLPLRTDEAGIRRFASLLEGLAKRLEDCGASPLSGESLAEAISRYNRIRRLWRGARRRWLDGLMSTAEYHCLRITALTSHPAAAEESFAEALSGQDGRDSQPAAPGVMVIGGDAVKKPLLLTVEDAGLRVVAEDSDADEREFLGEVSVGDDVESSILELARAYLTKPPSPRMCNPEARLAYLRGLIDERGVKGVVVSYYKFCDVNLAEYPLLSRQLREWGIPSILLEEETLGFSGQNLTRLEAFLEMLS